MNSHDDEALRLVATTLASYRGNGHPTEWHFVVARAIVAALKGGGDE